jgi:hypothetical protein
MKIYGARLGGTSPMLLVWKSGGPLERLLTDEAGEENRSGI